MRTFTISICTHNRLPELKRCLQSISLQDRLADVREVLIVDNASSDGTREWVENEAMASFPIGLRVVEEPELGLSKARNRAWSECETDVLICLDDDVTLRPGFIEAHMRAFDRPGTVLTGGRVLASFPETASHEIRALFDVPYGGPAAGYDFGEEPQSIGLAAGELQHVPVGANFGYLRSALDGPKPFNEAIGWGKRWIPGEESEVFLGLIRDGQVAWYVPGAIVDHHLNQDRLTVDYYLKWWLGQGRSEIYTRRWKSLWSKIYVSVTEYLVLTARLGWTRNDVARHQIQGQRARAQGRLFEAMGWD